MEDTTTVKVAEGGRVVIPARYRHSMGLKDGDEVVVRFVDGELRILTRAEAVRRAQEIVRRHVPKGRSLVSELSSERRKEAKSD